MTDRFAAAQRIADAVLYEGYLLYPYHAVSAKNRVRFQFGVVVPRAHAEHDGSETWEQQTELLAAWDGAAEARLAVRIRFLQLQARSLEAIDPEAPGGGRAVPTLRVGEDEVVAWDEAVRARDDVADLALSDLLAAGETGRTVSFRMEGGRDVEAVDDAAGEPVGRIIRTRWPIDGQIVVRARVQEGGLTRLTVRVENVTRLTDPAIPRRRLSATLSSAATRSSPSTGPRSCRRRIPRRRRSPRRPPVATSRSGRSSSARSRPPTSCSRRRSFSRTTRPWLPRARATSSTGPRSTRS